MISFELSKNIHESDFYTFETSWIGEMIYDIGNNTVTIPVLNLEVQNKEVLKLLSFDAYDCVYVRESWFNFTGVYKVEKKLHLQNEKKFVAKVNEELEFENIPYEERIFELGGMGVYNGDLYDGFFRIYASNCSFVIKENSPLSLDFISMNSYDPTKDDWLKK
ncbi:MAG: hypothetical protein MUF42_14625 [Cytophagaceae bacterium]|jgi:hypothetical protein|nr:hypothetical protein [Cytophagaceae bacterium]